MQKVFEQITDAQLEEPELVYTVQLPQLLRQPQQLLLVGVRRCVDIDRTRAPRVRSGFSLNWHLSAPRPAAPLSGSDRGGGVPRYAVSTCRSPGSDNPSW